MYENNVDNIVHWFDLWWKKKDNSWGGNRLNTTKSYLMNYRYCLTALVLMFFVVFYVKKETEKHKYCFGFQNLFTNKLGYYLNI